MNPDTEGLLLQRKRLMEGNQREVAAIIEDLEARLVDVRSQRDAEVHSLELLVAATTEKLRISNRRLRASEEAMVELQRETDRRTLELEHDLERTRGEFSLLQDSMRALVHAHHKVKTQATLCDDDQKAHKKKERLLELREIELVDQLADARSSVQRLREELAKKHDDYADMERSYLQSQREMASIQQQCDAATNAKHCNSELERSLEMNRLLQDSLHRVLHVIALYGSSTADDFDSLRRAREVFRYVTAVGGRQFSFLGDAVIKEFSRGGRNGDALHLQDLKHAIHNFNSTLNPSHASSPSWSTIDPFLRLETERDFWLPRQVLEVAAQFHKKYFHGTPIDVLYTLVVSVATAIRDYSSSILSPGEVALLSLDRNERKLEEHARTKKAVAAMSAQPATPPPRKGAQKDAASADQSPDVVRGITGLRCLLSQVDKLCSTSQVFKTLPAAQVREILSSCLRTFEALSRTSSGSLSTAAPPELNLHNLDTALEGVTLSILEGCTQATDATTMMFKATRNALKAPQDPSDPEMHPRDCCASRRHSVLTKQFKCTVLSALCDEQRRAVNIIETMRDHALTLRQVLYDFKLDHMRKPLR